MKRVPEVRTGTNGVVTTAPPTAQVAECDARMGRPANSSVPAQLLLSGIWIYWPDWNLRMVDHWTVTSA